MVFVVIIGIICGVVSFLPLWASLRVVRRLPENSNFSNVSVCLLTAFASMIILFGAALICLAIDRSIVLPFTVGEVAGLLVFAVSFAVSRAAQYNKNRQR